MLPCIGLKMQKKNEWRIEVRKTVFKFVVLSLLYCFILFTNSSTLTLFILVFNSDIFAFFISFFADFSDSILPMQKYGGQKRGLDRIQPAVLRVGRAAVRLFNDWYGGGELGLWPLDGTGQAEAEAGACRYRQPRVSGCL